MDNSLIDKREQNDMSFWKYIFNKPTLSAYPTKKIHEHKWNLQYQTGNPFDGKSDVVKCDCGQQAVYHRNPAFGETHKYHLIDHL